MRSFLIAAAALLLAFAGSRADAALDILGFDGGLPGAGQDFLDENDSDWVMEEGLFGDAGPEGDIWANDFGYPGWICDVCRDPETHTIDFAAMAYNAYFGEEPWALDSVLGVPFRVYNLQQEWVVIWFENFVFDLPSTHPDTLEVAIRLRSGHVKRMEVLQGGPDLPVGDPNPEPDGAGGEGDDGSDDDDYAENDDDIEEPEIDDPNGVVEIEDPDDDGEFPEWEEEL